VPYNSSTSALSQPLTVALNAAGSLASAAAFAWSIHSASARSRSAIRVGQIEKFREAETDVPMLVLTIGRSQERRVRTLQATADNIGAINQFSSESEHVRYVELCRKNMPIRGCVPFLCRVTLVLEGRQSMERIVKIKILIAFENEYHLYQSTIAAAIRIFRPHAEVETVGLEALEEKVERFDPQVVISSLSRIARSDSLSAWIELSIDPARPTKIYAGERCSEMFNPTVDKLLVVLDELEPSDVTNVDI
jgi:hypothetical protein